MSQEVSEKKQVVLEWEALENKGFPDDINDEISLYRARVRGGWLVLSIDTGAENSRLTFIPDEAGLWGANRRFEDD